MSSVFLLCTSFIMYMHAAKLHTPGQTNITFVHHVVDFSIVIEIKNNTG